MPTNPAETPTRRMLWASINGRSDASDKSLSTANNKILVSWRMFPEDDPQQGFDLYRSCNGVETKLNEAPICGSTNYQDASADRSKENTYRLCYAGSETTLDSYTLSVERSKNGLPYLSIPLHPTLSLGNTLVYRANDAAIGDLDGDGVDEIVVKRPYEVTVTDEDDNSLAAPTEIRHTTLFEAYRLDGSFLWRVCSGPNIQLGNSSSFAVCDFDGDGRCEVAMRTAEGTIFADGKEIGDVNKDGKTDYRVGSKVHGGPEFLSVIDGMTGRELARTDYIPLGKSEDWGDDYYKRSSSFRIGAGSFDGIGMSILICRGCYGKIVLEAWNYKGGALTRLWNFDTTKGYKAYEAQGYHNLRVADVDGDGYDEVVYGSCAIDHDGKGLYSTGLGHGDALHLGEFDRAHNGLETWGCYETGEAGASLRDARTGRELWRYNDKADVGRAMIADIDPTNPGYEMWWYKGNAQSTSGADLGYKPASCNMAVWWSGKLTRELLNGTAIDASPATGSVRYFTVYRYEVSSINGSKENPSFVGDFLGDWREEVIYPTSDNKELRIFSTWYPTEHKFPYLMSDHLYKMCVITQNIGYNQPNHLGYYLGADK